MNFVENLEKEVYCRIKPSPIHGVGVFAIRNIPAGVNPLKETRHAEFAEVPVKSISDSPELCEATKQLVKDMCPEEEGVYFIPPFSLNEIGLSYYLNHSKTPNMHELDGEFYTSKDITPGEELTVDYGTYGKENL